MPSPVFNQPPPGASLPTRDELRAIGQMGAAAPRAQRTALMNELGARLGIPPFGWNHGQARLFERNDIRLIWLLRRLAAGSAAERVQNNLRPLVSLTGADVMLAIVTTAREAGSSAVAAVSMDLIETWHQGGLDFLGRELPNLGLPAATVGSWRPLSTRLISSETKHRVFPAEIPARDQLVAYGAQIRYSFQHAFRKNLARVAGQQGASALGRSSRVVLLAWKALSFLAPGGHEYRAGETIAAQSGQTFGSRTALQYLAHRATTKGGVTIDLEGIVKETALNDVECVRSAKIRAAEALFLDHHLWLVRQVLPLATLWR